MTAKFPFAALALLITGFACILVSTDVDRWREQYEWLSQNWPWRMLGVFGGAAFFGGLIGIGFMFTSKTRMRVRLLAPVAGILAAQIGALILMAPGPIWRTIVGVVVLICTATLFRMDAE
jgi:hypothetical protein